MSAQGSAIRRRTVHLKGLHILYLDVSLLVRDRQMRGDGVGGGGPLHVRGHHPYLSEFFRRFRKRGDPGAASSAVDLNDDVGILAHVLLGKTLPENDHGVGAFDGDGAAVAARAGGTALAAAGHCQGGHHEQKAAQHRGPEQKKMPRPFDRGILLESSVKG